MTEHSRIEAALSHGVDIKGRRIFLHGSVEEDSIGVAIRGIYLLSDLSESPIELYVSSYGGDLDEAFALHDVTRTIRAPVRTVALGKCMSAAPLLVACGQPGQRWVAEHTTFMLHDCALGDIEGSPAFISAHVESAREQMRTMARLLAKYSKKDARHWSRIFAAKTDKFFSAQDAVDWGLVDQIWCEKE